MPTRRMWLPPLLIVLGARSAAGQQGLAVQLPSFSYFTVQTAVSVPDQGSAYVGGLNNSVEASGQFGSALGLPSGRVFGAERSTASVGVATWVHDLQAMDETLLSQRPYGDRPAKGGANGLVGVPVRAQGIGNGATPSVPAADPRLERLQSALAGQAGPVRSVAALRQEHHREQAMVEAQAAALAARGQAAEAAGRFELARIYRQLAARRAPGISLGSRP